MRCTWGKGDTKEDLTALMMHPTLAIAAGGKEQEEEEEGEVLFYYFFGHKGDRELRSHVHTSRSGGG